MSRTSCRSASSLWSRRSDKPRNRRAVQGLSANPAARRDDRRIRRQATTTRGAMRRRRQYQAAIAAVTARTGRAPDEATLAAELGVTIERLRADYETPTRCGSNRWTKSMPTTCLVRRRHARRLRTARRKRPARHADRRDRRFARTRGAGDPALLCRGTEPRGNRPGVGVGSARVCQIKAAAHARLKKALARKV